MNRTFCFLGSHFSQPGFYSVYLTLSPLITVEGSSTCSREVLINWNASFVGQDDVMEMYSSDPEHPSTEPVLAVAPHNASGFHHTGFTFNYPNISTLPFQSKCVGYWLKYLRKNETLSSNCIRAQPTWMWDLRDTIGGLSLKQLMIPGTHGSGSFSVFKAGNRDNFASRFIITQDEDILHQLLYGIRYLDIRLGYYKLNSEKVWLNHDKFEVHPWEILLNSVRKFLENTKEIVIIDLHRFPVGFHSNQNAYLFVRNKLYENFKEWVIPRSLGSNVTLNDLWEMDKRLIISHANLNEVVSFKWFWPTILQKWGNKQSLSSLSEYLRKINSRCASYYYFWAAMAELTPSSWDIILRPRRGLRRLAKEVMHNLTGWYDNLWWESSNIIAVDFFHGTNIVELCIKANLRRVGNQNVRKTTSSDC